MTTTPLPPTPRCDAEVYESGPTAANYGINDPDVVVDYTFAQQLERELIAADQARADLEAENKRLREALEQIKATKPLARAMKSDWCPAATGMVRVASAALEGTK